MSRERVAARLGDERGIALFMALAISFVLAVMGSAVVMFATTNEQSASRSRASERAYQLAQLGIENAVATISARPADLRDDADTFSQFTAAQRTESFGPGESVTWDGTRFDDAIAPAAPVYHKWRWTVTATATVPNPGSPGNMISRTVTADVRLRPTWTQSMDSEAWRFVYSWKTGDPDGCDLELPNNPNVSASFYVAGNLCLDNNSSIVDGGTDTEVIVHGNVELKKNSNNIGTNADPLDAVYVGGVCTFRSNPAHSPCTSVDRVWPNSQTPAGSQTISPPQADWNVQRVQASIGPLNGCNPDLSTGAYPDFTSPMGTWQLDQAASFSCKALDGSELTWDAATRHLTIYGLIYLDGNLDLESGDTLQYEGLGSIYVDGWYRQQQTRLCAVVSGGGCDKTFGAWDTTDDVLLIAARASHNFTQCTACSILIEQQAEFQGALFAEHSIGLQNFSTTQGPMVSKEEITQNQFTFSDMPTLVNVPFGTPGTSPDLWELVPPQNYTG